MNRKLRSSVGFTLIEVLISLAITAFVGAIAYSGLSSVISGVESTRVVAAQSYRLNRALMIVSRDLRQFVPRSIRDEFGEVESAMVGGPLSRSLLSFTRTGWHNPNQRPRSNLQRINYIVEDEALWRESYAVLDRAGDSKPQRVRLLKGVEEITIGFLASFTQLEAGDNDSGIDTSDWADNWIADTGTLGAAIDPPLAIEIRFTLVEGAGEITRLYTLPPY
ncbi:MAG: general secretion pathway protein J [Halioglobus sp.]